MKQKRDGGRKVSQQKIRTEGDDFL